MGEENKPEEESKPEAEDNNKKDQPLDNDAEKDDNKSAEIELKVYMHCEGCARKVRRCLKGFEGVEDVITDCKSSKVVVKGEKADPIKVLERVQRKSHRQVHLISPIPKPPAEEPKVEKEIPKIEDKKEEIPVITVVLTVYMHCEACAQEIKRRILKMKGVENVEPDHKSSQVTVTGSFLPENLADYVYKRTRKQATIVKVLPEKKEEEQGGEEKEEKEQEKSGDGGEKEEKKSSEEEVAGKEKKEAGDGGKTEAVVEDPKLEMKKNELFYCYPQYQHVYDPQSTVTGYSNYVYQPLMFSDENPNSCTVM